MPGSLKVRKAAAPPAGKQTTRVAVYEFVKGNQVVGSTEDPREAREQSKALGASVRVTSRLVTAGEPAA